MEIQPCSLCRLRPQARPERRHAAVPMDNFKLCVPCADYIEQRCGRRPCAPTSTTPSPVTPDDEKPTSDSDAGAHTAAGGPGSSLSPSSSPSTGSAVSEDIPEYRRAHIARLVVLVEQLAWRARGDKPCEQLRERIRVDSRKNLYKTPGEEEIGNGIDRRIIVIAAMMLQSVGVRLLSGKLEFPLEPITLPSDDKARTDVEYALISSAVHLEVSSLWDTAFEMYPWRNSITAHTIFECLFSLFGLELEPEKRVRSSRRRQTNTTITVMRDSVDNLLKLAAKHAPPAICTAIGTLDQEFTHHPELIREAAIASSAVPVRQLPADVCACCLNKHDPRTFPLRCHSCTNCERKFCTLCLERVFGPSEMVRATANPENFLCVLCRVTSSASAQTARATNLHKCRELRVHATHRKHLERIRAKKAPASRKRLKVPFLILSNNMACSVQNLPRRGGSTSTSTPAPMADVGFVKLCADINRLTINKYVDIGNSSSPHAGDSERPNNLLKEIPYTACFQCKLPLATRCDSGENFDFTKPCIVPEGAVHGLIFCSHKGCDVVMHKDCASLPDSTPTQTPESEVDSLLDSDIDDTGGAGGDDGCGNSITARYAAGITAIAKASAAAEAGPNYSTWLCPRHECAICSKPAVRSTCRTCTTAYCAAHQPPRASCHVYSSELISCEKCKPKLAAPRFPLEVKDKQKLRQPTNNPPVTLKDALRIDKLNAMDFINKCIQLRQHSDIRDIGNTKKQVFDLTQQFSTEANGTRSSEPDNDEPDVDVLM